MGKGSTELGGLGEHQSDRHRKRLQNVSLTEVEFGPTRKMNKADVLAWFSSSLPKRHILQIQQAEATIINHHVSKSHNFKETGKAFPSLNF